MAARSPVRSIAGPDVTLLSTPSSAAMICAKVVFPRPGGPYSNTWSRASPRFLAASIAISRFSFTLFCPINSVIRLGRKFVSSGLSSEVGFPDTIRVMLFSF